MSLPSSNYNLFGVTGFSFINPTRFNLEASIDSRFVLNTSGSSYNTTVSFIIVGNSPSSVCSGYEGTIPSYDRCVQSCASDQSLFNYFGQNARGCIDCPSYAYLRTNPTNTDCICQ